VTLTQVRSAEIQRWNAFAEPAFPAGHWMAHLTIAHDASGGEVIAQIDFQTATAELSSRMFNLENLAVTNLTAAGALPIRIETRNLETFQRNATFDHGFALIMVDDASSGRGIEPRDMAFLPWFLGAPREANVAAGLDLRISNNGVGDRTTVVARGYFWEPRSTRAPGGPQRPPTSLYR